MEIFFSIFNTILIFVFAKYSIGILSKFFVEIKSPIDLIKYLFLPFFYKSSKIISRKRFIASELFSILVGVIFSLGLISMFQSLTVHWSQIVMLYIYLLLIILFFLYLAIHDILFFTVPIDLIKTGLIVLVILNVVTAVFKLTNIFEGLNQFSLILKVGGLDNFTGAVVGFLFIFLIVKLTNNQGMGEGDIDTSLIMGLILGLKGVIIAYLVTFIIGGAIGAIYALYKKKIKGVIIPFVPLQVLGLLLTIILYSFNALGIFNTLFRF